MRVLSVLSFHEIPKNSYEFESFHEIPAARRIVAYM